MDVGASKSLSWEGGCRDMAGGAIDVEGHRGHGCRGIERAVVGRWLPGYGSAENDDDATAKLFGRT